MAFSSRFLATIALGLAATAKSATAGAISFPPASPFPPN